MIDYNNFDYLTYLIRHHREEAIFCTGSIIGSIHAAYHFFKNKDKQANHGISGALGGLFGMRNCVARDDPSLEDIAIGGLAGFSYYSSYHAAFTLLEAFFPTTAMFRQIDRTEPFIDDPEDYR